MPRPDFSKRSLRTFVRDDVARRVAVLVLLGLPNCVIFAAAVYAEPMSATAASPCLPYASYVVEAALRFGIPEHWITAVLTAESAGDVRAISSAGAMGLMQVMPDTWAQLRERYPLGDDPFDPRDNILAGTAYLREMFDRYGSVAAMLAAYNAGPGRYDDYLANGRTLPGETRAYVASLVHLMDGEALPTPRQTAPQIPNDWRSAPMFVALGNAHNALNTVLAEGRQRAVRSPAAAQHEGNFDIPSQSLFFDRPAVRAGQ